MLIALSAAARSQQRVRLSYRSQDNKTSERTLDVYGLAYRGAWYAVGFCHLRQDVRSFRLDRMVSVTPLPQPFGRPAGFDALDFLVRSMASLPRAHAIEVLLHTDLDSARQALPGALGTLHAERSHTLLSVQADGLEWFARELARLPFGFAVRRPLTLRQALVRHARQLLLARGASLV